MPGGRSNQLMQAEPCISEQQLGFLDEEVDDRHLQRENGNKTKARPQKLRQAKKLNNLSQRR